MTTPFLIFLLLFTFPPPIAFKFCWWKSRNPRTKVIFSFLPICTRDVLSLVSSTSDLYLLSKSSCFTESTLYHLIKIQITSYCHDYVFLQQYRIVLGRNEQTISRKKGTFTSTESFERSISIQERESVISFGPVEIETYPNSIPRPIRTIVIYLRQKLVLKGTLI